MAANYHFERAKVAKNIIENMFRVKKGETVAITADSGSDMEIVNAFADAAYAAGAKPLVMRFPKAEQDGQAGMPDWPSEALTAALCHVDVWIELQEKIILYSDIWETAFKENKKLRYLVIADTPIKSLMRLFANYDVKMLGKFLNKVREQIKASRKVRITSENGTDVYYEIEPTYLVDVDDGDYSKPKFGTAPGYVNIVPKIGSMNGRIVFDKLMNVDISGADDYVEFVMSNGSIAEIKGNRNAEIFKDYLASFNDPNMYRISHNMLGFHPNVRKLSGKIVEDERIWGGVDFGFGHTSPMDMPPHGQPAASHYDGVIERTSIYLDDELIVKNGEVYHDDLKELANKLLEK
jgi:leucyl aminopeptidase (aminopeptidase T)